MTDLMQTIYDHLLDEGYGKFLSQDSYGPRSQLLLKKENALLETLSDTQQELFSAYQLAAGNLQLLELEAMFQAGFRLARELLD